MMIDGKWARRILEWRVEEGKWNRSRPPTHWSHDLKRLTGSWMRKAHNRKEMKSLEVNVPQ